MRIDNLYFKPNTRNRLFLTIDNGLDKVVQIENGVYTFEPLLEYNFNIVSFENCPFYGNINQYLIHTKQTFDYFNNKLTSDLEVEIEQDEDGFFYSKKIPIINNYCKIHKLYVADVVGEYRIQSNIFNGYVGFKNAK